MAEQLPEGFTLLGDNEVPPEVRVRYSPPPTPPLSNAQRFVRQAAPSVIGGAIGGAVGTLATPFTAGILNPVSGAMIGSGLGELASQTVLSRFTGAQPSKTQLSLATAAPLLGPAVRGLGHMVPGVTPGLQQAAQKAVGGLHGQKIVGAVSATPDEIKMLFRQTGGLRDFPVVLTSTKETAKGLKEEIGDFTVSGFKSIVKRGETMAGRQGLGAEGVMPFRMVRVNLSQLGASVRRLEKAGGQTAGAAKKMYGALISDLESTLSQVPKEHLAKYRLAIEATKREQLGEFITDAFKSGIGSRVGQGQLAFDSIHAKLLKNQDILEKLVPKSEVKAITNIIADFAKSTPLSSSVAGEGLRGIVAPERIMAGAALGIGAKMLGMDWLPSTAVMASGIVGIEVLAKTLSSPVGRATVAHLATKGYTVDQIINALGQGGRAAFTPPAPQRAGAPLPR